MTGAPYNYESVEYSDGYYHTVFRPDGIAVCDCASETEAQVMVERLNQVDATNGTAGKA